MEDNKSSLPIFKKIDTAIFQSIDKFKLTPNYNTIQDFYNGLEEEQQKAMKALVLLLTFVLPVVFLTFLWWQNSNLRADLELRTSMVSRANEIIGQKQGIRDIAPQVMSMNPIDGQSMMSSRLSTIASGIGIDLSKIRVSDFNSNMITDGTMKSEAEFAFNNFSTDELMNIFIAMIQNEKFRIQSVKIKKSTQNNLLTGQFHAIHYSIYNSQAEE